MTNDVFGIGLAGSTITPLERDILQGNTPYAVVLFGRNIEDEHQLRDLVAEIKSISTVPPLMMIDEEGGRVDRLRTMVRGLPSAEAFGEGEKPAEMAEWFGRVIGKALHYFDVELDLAPVVDIPGELSPKGLERRMFGRDAASVIELAGAFMRGLHAEGVASCPKHWPGIGLGSADAHYGQTEIDVTLDELKARDVEPYRALANEAGAVMIGHGTYPQIDEPNLPATLSRRMSTELLRGFAGFTGVAISDDMEMHAVSDLGSYEMLSERALLAGNDVILFCSHIERVPDLQRAMAQRVREDAHVAARFAEAVQRCEAFRAHCASLRAAAPPPGTFAAVLDEAARFVEEFNRTRPHREIVIPDVDRRKHSRVPRTGREEWT